jgi:hypothetical protein
MNKPNDIMGFLVDDYVAENVRSLLKAKERFYHPGMIVEYNYPHRPQLLPQQPRTPAWICTYCGVPRPDSAHRCSGCGAPRL